MYQTLIKPLAKDVYHFILDTLFPIYCLVCEKEDKGFICDECINKLTKLQHQHCIICKKPSIGGLTHPACKTLHSPEGLISIFDYHDKTVADILIKGKYKFLPKIYEILAELVVQNLLTDFPDILNFKSKILNPLLVPLPLHKSRLRWRGFNQSRVLVQSIGNLLSLPYNIVLVRCKSTKTQKDLKREERIKNVSAAFKLNDNANIKDKNIILIDDVVTTGSTLLEACKVLKRNGAKDVWCLTVARD